MKPLNYGFAQLEFVKLKTTGTDFFSQLLFFVLRHQADVIGVIAEELVKIGYLRIPEDKCNICTYGVKKS